MKERDRLIALNGKLEEVEQRWTLTCFVKESGCSNIFDTILVTRDYLVLLRRRLISVFRSILSLYWSTVVIISCRKEMELASQSPFVSPTRDYFTVLFNYHLRLCCK